MEDVVSFNMHDEVIKYYKDVFANDDIDIDIFCHRCGLFGHVCTSKVCLFYNVYYELKMTKETVNYCMEIIINKVVDKVQNRVREIAN